MKIKIVVRPEDGQKADAAAENARRVRQKRARWGLAALFGIFALSVATIAFFFIGRRNTPTDVDQQPVASAPAATDAGAEPGTPLEPDDAAPPGQRGDGRSSPVPAAPDAGEAPPEAGIGTAAPATTPEAAADNGPEQQVEPAPLVDLPPHAAEPVLAPAAPSPAGKPSPATAGAAASAPAVARVPARPETGVVRAQLTSRVVNREPADALHSPVDVEPGGRDVYYFNELRNLNGRMVTHRWEYNGQVMATVPFRIKGDRWRVYSIKRIGENQRGIWRVTTLDNAGSVLARAEFRAE